MEGILTATDQSRAGGVYVVLVPDNLREIPDLYKRVLFAWEAIEDFAYYDPTVLTRFEQQGKSIRVLGDSRQTVKLTMIPHVPQ